MKKTNMRAGFTMIELIFVIVIIGILAAIAMNKLSATRDDAKISQIIANTKTFVNDAKAYYTSQGINGWKRAKVSDVTDVPLYYNNCSTDAQPQAVDQNSSTSNKFFYLCANGKKIVKIATEDQNLTVSVDSDGNGTTVGNAVANDPTFKALEKTIRLGGVGINRD